MTHSARDNFAVLYAESRSLRKRYRGSSFKRMGRLSSVGDRPVVARRGSKTLQIEQVIEFIVQVYYLVVLLAPVFALSGFLALILGFLRSDRFKVWVLSKLTIASKIFDKPNIGAQCARFMKPRIRELNNENPEATLPLINLKFTKYLPESVKLGPNEDNVIIVLRNSKNKAENLLKIAERYVSKGVMPRGHCIVDKNIEKAVKVTMMHRLLSDIDQSLRLWEEKHYKPCVSIDDLRETLETVYYIDKLGGYLTRLFLPQLELVARRHTIGIDTQIFDESREWLRNVHDMARKHDSDPDVFRKHVGTLDFFQGNIGVSTVLVARSSAIRKSGIERHKRRVILALNSRVISEVYLIGTSQRNCFHTLRLLGETYLDKRIAEVWPTFYRTRSRGEDGVPIVLVRYIKAQAGNDQKKKEVVRRFQKEVRKQLKRVLVTPNRLIDWVKEHGERNFGRAVVISELSAQEISKIMTDEDMTMDALSYIFENEDTQLRYEDMLTDNEIESLGPRDEIVFRIYTTLGEQDSDILPHLDPNIFMNRKKKM